ncbi:hypothetical protein AMTR_s00072p00174930 [Amborella trichopoda]|uniref:Uncharacterized protein n=1 Tax=Amborella trichopoda TaxID=13333 RepID=W1NS80_AMBTC|nr:hypothetical protein AMTR_s00072p00174930 [Amborella trichopoda]
MATPLCLLMHNCIVCHVSSGRKRELFSISLSRWAFGPRTPDFLESPGCFGLAKHLLCRPLAYRGDTVKMFAKFMVLFSTCFVDKAELPHQELSNDAQSLLKKPLVQICSPKIQHACEEKVVLAQVFDFTTRTRNRTSGLRLLMEDIAISPHCHNDRWAKFYQRCTESEKWSELAQRYEEN